jgi:hypothetical protein
LIVWVLVESSEGVRVMVRPGIRHDKIRSSFRVSRRRSAMKKLAVWVAMLAMVLAVASPALAQEDVIATGVIEKPQATSYMYGSHAITDEVSGIRYALRSESVDLDGYVGQRVTVYGTVMPGYENGQIEGGPPLLNITRVELA